MTTGFASTPKSTETLIRLPRYTSYPTAMSFTGAVGPDQFAAWASAVPAETVMSAYIHVPFCHSLCWFCGCQTSITSRYRPVAAYVETLLREIDLVAGLLRGRRTIERLHWGGGTPTMIAPDDWMSIDERLRQRFNLAEDAEISIELDPRSVGDDHLRALAATGVTRASIGVQDFDLEVQKSVNRVQPPQLTARLTAKLRGIGVANVNIDLMYGLPRQTEAGVARTA
ncbi:MAG: radical SAM protein, partial [Bauldia litoralis]